MKRVDWTSQRDVIALAKKLGPQRVVYKLPGQGNFFLTHVDQPDWKQPGAKVITKT